MIRHERAVFDCNVFLQAMAAPHGAAGRCLDLALAGAVTLYVSPYVLAELRDVSSRPRVIVKMRLSAVRVDAVLHAIEAKATFVSAYPEPFQYPRDPDDAHYINLALAAGAMLVVSNDKDLLDLMKDDNPEGCALRSVHAKFRVLTPPKFLEFVDAPRI